MEGVNGHGATKANHAPPVLHTAKLLPHVPFNRIFAPVYACAILALFYHHARSLVYSTNLASFFISLLLLIADIVLAFQWTNTEAFRMRPIQRKEYPENLDKVVKRSEFPGMDVFICTADPYKEPPIGVVNTALSVMAYDYPTEKISVYVSDDGGSALTLFAFMEAAKFAKEWLPFCRKHDIMDRNPEAYFVSKHPRSSEIEKLKMMYETMKVKIEHVLERGKVDDRFINGEKEAEAFKKWTDKFTKQEHPTVIEVLLDTSKDRDVTGQMLPNLVYVSREKSKSAPHHFKGGAQNVLLRVSAAMTNAPIILTLDCDMYSNDPRAPLRALCYFSDAAIRPKLGFVQFPQRFRGVNKHDIYAGEYLRLFIFHSLGFDGLRGGNFVGTGCFFNRRVFFGGPANFVPTEIPELDPGHAVGKPIHSEEIRALAHRVASCTFEQKTDWGSKKGFKYGCVVEDMLTSFRLQCEGWHSVLCNPERHAFLGDVPIALNDVMSQQKRWARGLLEINFSKYNPLFYCTRHMGILMGLAYSYFIFWPYFSIPITIYAFVPQLALLNRHYIFPSVSEPWFFLYVFLVLGAYGQDILDFLLSGGTLGRWWNDQRMWNLRGLAQYLFAFMETFLNALGLPGVGFNVTSKVLDDEQVKRYEQGLYEFGVHSPMLVSLTTAAFINLFAFTNGLVQIFVGGKNWEQMCLQMFLAGFAVVNCMPIYEAIALRRDKGKMPIRTTLTAAFLTGVLCYGSSLLRK